MPTSLREAKASHAARRRPARSAVGERRAPALRLVRPRPPDRSPARPRERRAADRVLVELATQPLRPGAPLLLLEATFAGGCARLRRNALSLHPECVSQRTHEPVNSELAVAGLAPLVLRNCSQDGAGPRDHAPLLRLGQRARRLDVEDCYYPRLRLSVRAGPRGRSNGRPAARSPRAGGRPNG